MLSIHPLCPQSIINILNGLFLPFCVNIKLKHTLFVAILREDIDMRKSTIWLLAVVMALPSPGYYTYR